MDTPSKHDRGLQARESSQIIKAEPNLLRLPFFALATKGLKNIGGYECTGTMNRAGKRYDFTFSVERSLRSTYPGLLSRKAHLAIVSILTEQSIPFANPVSWTWGDLCKRMHVSKSGRKVLELKTALESSASLTIKSRQALWSKAETKPISTKSGRVTHLYDDVVFIDDHMPDGSIADTNYLWFSQWYLDNFNAHYYTKLDFELWNYLDNKSPIASRIYELSLSKFRGTSLLRINYPTLAKLLPVKPERYLSDAKKQLSHGFKVATEAGVTKKPEWLPRKDKQIAQLRIQPGRHINASNQILLTEETIEDLAIQEIKAPESKTEYRVVTDFYNQWGSEDRKPTPNELNQATELVSSYGNITPKLIARAVKTMQTEFPKAKRFGAAIDFIHQAAKDEKSQQARKRAQRRKAKKAQSEQQTADRDKAELNAFMAQWQSVWDDLPTSDQKTIWDNVHGSSSMYRFENPRHRQSILALEPCFKELARRTAAKS